MRHLPALALIAALCAAGIFASAAQARYVPFQSPSGNIGCYMTAGSVRCDIDKHTWPTPAKPSSCDVDYGGGLTVGKTGRGTFFCAGDTALHAGPVLPYGSSKSLGRFTCTSREAGMTCRNRRNGHGFFLSRQSYKRL